MAKDKLKPGTLIRIKPIPGFSIATFYEGKLGVIVGVPKEDAIEYEIYVNEKTLWLIRGEFELVN
jgi:hypothetical protein